jgi:hypothetical protein
MEKSGRKIMMNGEKLGRCFVYAPFLDVFYFLRGCGKVLKWRCEVGEFRKVF